MAQCVHYCADERPSAEHLLKHRFFKLAARHPQHLVRHLWRQVPEDSDRSGSSSHLASDSDAGGLLPPGPPDSCFHAEVQPGQRGLQICGLRL